MNNEELNNVVKESKAKFDLKKEIFEWFYTIIAAVAIVFVIKSFLFDLVVVDGPSMFPTLVHGDRLVVTKLGYKPEQQDIIVLDSTYRDRTEYYEEIGADNVVEKIAGYIKTPKNLKHRYYVKRIIAMPGQTVDINRADGKVYVDGELLDESSYYNNITTTYDSKVEFPFTVSEGCVFVLGDNRPQSKDSRSSELGEVPIDAIFGKCAFRLWPLTSVGLLSHGE